MDLKAELHSSLQVTRGVHVAKREGLSDYDARRPMTFSLPWVEDGSIWDGADTFR